MNLRLKIYSFDKWIEVLQTVLYYWNILQVEPLYLFNYQETNWCNNMAHTSMNDSTTYPHKIAPKRLKYTLVLHSFPISPRNTNLSFFNYEKQHQTHHSKFKTVKWIRKFWNTNLNFWFKNMLNLHYEHSFSIVLLQT